ncbi:MAG TPA: metallophosphoesterase family protein [Kofleriaceae bacterium]|nr:metallophosphoesterase family protein [Kofleriaceae bacterium]
MPAALRRAATTIAAPAEGPVRLAVVADTHSAPHPAAAGLLAAYAPTAILHAGDIGDLRVLRALEAIAPLHAIRGNIDDHGPDLPDVLTIDVARAGAPPLRILLVHIGVAGVRLRPEVARTARAEGAAVVVCGHSHVPFVGDDRGLLVFNPGSVGPRRFHLPIVFGTMEIGARVRFAHVDAETGRAWSPPR